MGPTCAIIEATIGCGSASGINREITSSSLANMTVAKYKKSIKVISEVFGTYPGTFMGK